MSNVSKRPTAEQLAKLSDEVNRIAGVLARMSTQKPAPPERGATSTPKLEVPVEAVRSAIRARRLRERYFSEELFADPAWDMMLELLLSDLSGQRVTVSTLCSGACVPATTALRWLKTLVQNGIFVRRPDPLDGRRVFVELAPDASAALRAYFQEIIELSSGPAPHGR